MDYYRFVAIILVYRNSSDLVDCIKSMRNGINSLKIVVVDAYYDDETKENIREIAAENGCDFISIENKGYGFGNNAGIEFALNTYSFDYLIISNPDIIVKKFDADKCQYDIIAPSIRNKCGKAQNPMYIRKSRITHRIIYYGMKKRIKLFVFFGVSINRMCRELGMFFRKNKSHYKIYQPHGSFVILSKEVINRLHPIYDEKMFLFAEENVLSKKCFDNGFECYYVPSIKLLHKEDGSMKLFGNSISEELR